MPRFLDRLKPDFSTDTLQREQSKSITRFIGDVPYVDEEAVKENSRRPITACNIDAERAIRTMLDINPSRRVKLADLPNLAFFTAAENRQIMPSISTLQKLPQNVSLVAPQ